MYIAHKNDKNEIQTVKQHSENTAKLCREFSVDILKDAMYAMGLMHDIGKYQKDFQLRINGKNIRVEHSTCGALAAADYYKDAFLFLCEYCITGHHSGIPDYGFKNITTDPTSVASRKSHHFQDYSAYKNEFEIPKVDNEKLKKFIYEDCTNKEKLKEDLTEKFAFITRYCFSCLTDADSLDTAKFCNGEQNRTLKSDFKECLDKVNIKLNSFTAVTDLQKTRSLLQRQVYKRIDEQAAIYLMNMPTGSGKTLCSVKFALERAIKSGKKRIIYIIPYNSIIDQTSDVFDELFGDSANILRHQSTFSYDDIEDKEEDYKLTAKLATENWDADFIITTAVQFFESIYSNKRGKLRKLHNMADSILIFDEAHLMPRNYLQPCLRAISYITKYLNSEAVFLTATMPNFKKLIDEYAMKNLTVLDLVENKKDFSRFSKCEYKFIGGQSFENLAQKSFNSPSSLIIVNKRASAKKLFSLCQGKKYHLSTYMTAFDRKNVIDEIKSERAKLENDYPEFKNVPGERRITVISTSLIEAGVDLDFFTVLRELSGLDSILQAGGRCNREGKRKSAEVSIFTLDSERGKPSSDERANITRGIIKEFSDISSPESIGAYYERLFFSQRDEITKNSISSISPSPQIINFKEYAEKFELIESKTVSIIVARDKTSNELIDKIKFTKLAEQRKLQKYACTVYQNEFDELLRQHVVDDFESGIYCLTNPDYYDAATGIRFEGEDKIV